MNGIDRGAVEKLPVLHRVWRVWTARGPIAGACLGLALGCAPAAQCPPGDAGAAAPSVVRVEAVEADRQGAALSVPGVVAFDEERVAAIIPPVQGRVVRLLAATGDHVGASAPLALVYSADVAGAGAGLAEARIARIAAEQNLARAERLSIEGAGSLREVVDARTNLATARAEEARAAAVLRSMGAPASGAGMYTLRSPIAGTVVRRALRVGAEARPDAAEPAFLVSDLSHVWVLAHVHEGQGSVVRAGDAAEVTFPSLPGTVLRAPVARVADAVDPDTRTLVVRIPVENRDGLLRPEMFARVNLRSSARVAITVPVTAVITVGGEAVVLVERAPGRYERRAVVLGAEIGERVQVLGGLRPGERVVTRGALLLAPEASQVL